MKIRNYGSDYAFRRELHKPNSDVQVEVQKSAGGRDLEDPVSIEEAEEPINREAEEEKETEAAEETSAETSDFSNKAKKSQTKKGKGK